MREIRTLFLLELRSLFGINRFLHTKDKKEKKRVLLLSLVWMLLIVMIFCYVGALTFGLCTLGLSEIVFAYLITLSSLLILFFGIFTAGGRIFGGRGYDILASMPIRQRTLVISRFLGLYTEDLLFTLVIMLPGILVYGVMARSALGFYAIALLGTMLIPTIPLVISTLIGTLIMALSSHMKNKSMMQTLLMVQLVVGVLIGSFSLGNASDELTPDALARLAEYIGSFIARVYPPAVWLGEAMTDFRLIMLLVFVLVSLAVMTVAICIASLVFFSVMRRLGSIAARHDYKIGEMESRSLGKALYFREMKRYFSSSIYVTNTIIGPIMGTILSAALCFFGMDAITDAIPLALDMTGIMPFLFAGVFCMMTTTSVSISIEGCRFWIIRSLPIPTKALLDAKILWNLSLMLPFYLVSTIFMIIAAKPRLLDALWLCLVPASLILFSVVFGITVNLKLHSFDWENEATVVKQSLPAMLGGFAGFFLSVLSAGVLLLVPARRGDMAKLMLCLILWTGTVCLYRHNNKKSILDL